jgi:hypothetical protein
MTTERIQRELALCLMSVTLFQAAHAADQAKKDRCTQYAQRAIEQYQAMQSHPNCHVPDDLNWQNNIDNHYNGCMAFGETVCKLAESGRLNHLQACGALVDGAPAPQAADPPSQSPVGDAGAPASQPQPVADGVAQTQFRVRPLLPMGPPLQAAECKRRGPSFPGMVMHGSGATDASISNGILRYTDAFSHKAMSFPITRPPYVAEQIKCQNAAGDSGEWIWVAPGGASGYLFIVSPSGLMQAQALDKQKIKLFMQPIPAA